MRPALTVLLMTLTVLVCPNPSPAFDYNSCVRSGAGSNLERMGGAAWRKLYSLEQRKAMCAQVDDENKALEQDRRRASQQRQQEQEQDQLAREQGRQAQDQSQQARDRARMAQEEEQRDEERQQVQQERDSRYFQTQLECARSGACSSASDIREQIRRSQEEFRSTRATPERYTDAKNRFVLLDEVKEPPAARRPEISFGAHPNSPIRYIRIVAADLIPPREIHVVCDQEARHILLTTTSTESGRTAATYEASRATVAVALASQSCELLLAGARIEIPQGKLAVVWGDTVPPIKTKR